MRPGMEENTGKTGTRYSLETWAEIRRKVCAGMTAREASTIYGPTPQVITNRSRNEQWPTKHRLRVKQRESGIADDAAPDESKHSLAFAPAPANSLQMQESCNKPPDSPISRFHLALQSLVESPPADFQAAFAGVAQAAIAEGLPEIPAPRSIKELATWFDLWRKAAGLDIKEKSAGITPLVNPMRTVSRRAGSQVIEAEPLPGTPEFDAWEV